MTIPFRTPEAPTDASQQQGTPAEQQPQGVTLEQIQQAITQAIQPYAQRLEQIEQRFAPPKQADDPGPDLSAFYNDPVAAASEIARRQAEATFQKSGAMPAQVAMRVAVRNAISDLAQNDPAASVMREEFEKAASGVDPQVLMSEYRDPFDPEKTITGMETLWRTFKGTRSEQIAEKMKAASRERPRVPFSESPQPRTGRAANRQNLDDEERQIAKKFGMDEQTYLKVSNTDQGEFLDEAK